MWGYDEMRNIPILTTEVALRIEEALPHVAALSRESQALDSSTVARFGRAVASKAKEGRPRNYVFCFGHEDIEHFEDILAFYTVDELEPAFLLAPMRFSHEVAAELAAAGFTQNEYGGAILYGAPLEKIPELPSRLTIERVTSSTLEEFALTTATAFEWPAEWQTAAMQQVIKRFRPDSYHVLARFDGELAGVASLEVRDGVGGLGDCAVVPRFRRKGIHLALICHRLHAAGIQGCDLVSSGAGFGSGSFRNQQRAGLRLAWVESGWSRVKAGR